METLDQRGRRGRSVAGFEKLFVIGIPVTAALEATRHELSMPERAINYSWTSSHNAELSGLGTETCPGDAVQVGAQGLLRTDRQQLVQLRMIETGMTIFECPAPDGERVLAAELRKRKDRKEIGQQKLRRTLSKIQSAFKRTSPPRDHHALLVWMQIRIEEVVMKCSIPPKLSRIGLFLVAAMAISPAQSQSVDLPDFMLTKNYPTPFCTNRGQRVELGQTSCLKGYSVDFLARCIVVLNNPSWAKVHAGCAANSGEDKGTKQ